MTLATIFLFGALICFILGAAGANRPVVGWRDAGFAFVVAAVLAGQIVLAG